MWLRNAVYACMLQFFNNLTQNIWVLYNVQLKYILVFLGLQHTSVLVQAKSRVEKCGKPSNLF